MTSANADQREYWNGPGGQSWSAGQAQMDRFLRPFAEGLLARAAPGLRARVLDIGCGAGETTLMAARAAGPEGAALGVDISQPLIELARARAGAEGLPNAAFMIGDAQTDALADALGTPADLVLSRFGVMFFEDPAAAFANIRRHTKPGGRLCFVCWQPVRENEWVTIGLGIAKKHVAFPPPPDPYAPGPFALADIDRTLGLLAQAGWQAPEAEPFSTRISQGATPAEAAENLMLRGPISRAMAAADAAQRAAVLEELTAALAPMAGPDGVALGAAVWFVSARN